MDVMPKPLRNTTPEDDHSNLQRKRENYTGVAHCFNQKNEYIYNTEFDIEQSF